LSAPRPKPEEFTLRLPPRQAEALRALAALEDLPPEVYAEEVLAKHLYHSYTPSAAREAAGRGQADRDPADP
jgi:hypothetical protein